MKSCTESFTLPLSGVPAGFLLQGGQGKGAPQSALCSPKNFKNTTERTIETTEYCFKQQWPVVVPPPLKIFPAKSQSGHYMDQLLIRHSNLMLLTVFLILLDFASTDSELSFFVFWLSSVCLFCECCRNSLL